MKQLYRTMAIYPSTDISIDKQNVVYPYDGILFDHKKE